MSASHCETCGTEGKTYWVSDKEWLCAACFKAAKTKPQPIAINEVVCKICGWKHVDPPGMGTHQPLLQCIECGGKMIIKPITQSLARFACGLQLDDEDL